MKGDTDLKGVLIFIAIFLIVLVLVFLLLDSFLLGFYFTKELGEAILWKKAVKGKGGLIVATAKVGEATVIYITAKKLKRFESLVLSEILGNYDLSIVCSTWYFKCKGLNEVSSSPWSKLVTTLEDVREAGELKKDCLSEEAKAYMEWKEKVDEEYANYPEDKKVNVIRNECAYALLLNCKECFS